MSAGDAQRIWFPMMLDQLRPIGSSSFEWFELIDFCRKMDVLRIDLKRTYGLNEPISTCHKCGHAERGVAPKISVRSALFAMLKEGMISQTQLKSLDRDWAKFRRPNKLDSYGERLQNKPTNSDTINQGTSAAQRLT